MKNPLPYLVVVCSLWFLGGAARGQSLGQIDFFNTGYAGTRAIAYDAQRHLIFASVPTRNSLYVISEATHKEVARVNVPNPSVMDFTPDHSRLYIGTQNNFASNEAIYVLDCSTLQLVDRIKIPSFSPNASIDEYTGITLMATAANGKVWYVAYHFGDTGSALVEWDPSLNTFQRVLMPGLIAVNSLARSGDGSKILISGSRGNENNLALYESAADAITKTVPLSGPPGAQVFGVAGNADGSKWALRFNGVTLVDANLQQLAQGPANVGGTILFSADGTKIYANGGSSSITDPLSVLDASNLSSLGLIPSGLFLNDQMNLQTTTSAGVLLGFDGFFPGTTGTGVFFISPVAPINLLGQPIPRSSNPMTPDQSALSGASSATYNGGDFAVGANVFFGSHSAIGATRTSPNVIQLGIPPGDAQGPVMLTYVDPRGWVMISPDGFSYGPKILRLGQTAGPTQGGNTVDIYGYGLDYFPTSSMHVTIGGVSAPIVSAGGAPGSVTYEPVMVLRVIAPPSGEGTTDIVINTPNGSDRLSQSYSYYRMDVIPTPERFNQMVLDRNSDRLFATNTTKNRVDVFSTESERFLFSIPTGRQPVGLDQTPDGKKILTANIDSISMLDATGGTAGIQIPTIPSDLTGTLQPLRIVATGDNHAFYSQTAVGALDNGALSEVKLDTKETRFRGDLLGFTTSDVLFAPSYDRNRIFMKYSNRRGTSGGIPILWDAVTDTARKAGLSLGATDLAGNAEGTMFAANRRIFDMVTSFQALTDKADPLIFDEGLHAPIYGETMSPGGSLLYIPNDDRIDIYDVRTGRCLQRIALPEAPVFALESMTVDPSGRFIYLMTQSGIMKIDIRTVPLSVAGTEPDHGLTNTAYEVLIHGSGFKPGAQVKVGGVQVGATFLDENTLSTSISQSSAGFAAVQVTNPSGDSYTLPLGFDFISQYPTPSVVAVKPTEIGAGEPGLRLVVSGSDFQPGATLKWNGADRSTTVVDSTALVATLSADDLATPGTNQLMISNPLPNRGEMTAVNYLVQTAVRSTFALPNGFSFTTAVGGTSAPKITQLTNTGNVTLHLGRITTTGDFSQTNDCPAVLAVRATCIIQVSFRPLLPGFREGTLRITDSSGVATQAPSPLFGTATGTGISLAIGRPSRSSRNAGTGIGGQMVRVGESTAIPVNLGAALAAGTQVKLACTNDLPNGLCSVSPAEVTAGGGDVPLTVTVTTNGQIAARSGRLMANGVAGRRTVTRPGTYSVTVTATVGQATQTLSIPITVQ